MGKDLKGKELGVGISQRKDGVYTARFTDKFGKRQQKYFVKLSDCKEWIAKAEYIDKSTDAKHPYDLSFDGLYQLYIQYKSRLIRYNTSVVYKNAYEKHIKQHIGDMKLSSIKPLHCQLILNDMADRGLKSTTIKKVRECLSSIFNYAVDNGLIQNSPCNKSVRWDIGEDSGDIRVLSRTEQKAFIEAIKSSNLEYRFRFALQTGMRTGEIAALEWKDIDFDKKIISISKTMMYVSKKKEWMVGKPKTKGSIRKIPLTDEAISILLKQKSNNRQIKVVPIEYSDFVFLNRKGEPYKNNACNMELRRICEESGIDLISMHTLRHTFATRCIEAGMQPKILQNILGHSNIKMTMDLYVHATEEEKMKQIEIVAKAINVC